MSNGMMMKTLKLEHPLKIWWQIIMKVSAICLMPVPKVIQQKKKHFQKVKAHKIIEHMQLLVITFSFRNIFFFSSSFFGGQWTLISLKHEDIFEHFINAKCPFVTKPTYDVWISIFYGTTHNDFLKNFISPFILDVRESKNWGWKRHKRILCCVEYNEKSVWCFQFFSNARGSSKASNFLVFCDV